MGQRSIKGSSELAKCIRLRRNELNLTIEEAASKAGVGTKTWSRYESGESIRKDKCIGICKALNWHALPDGEDNDTSDTLNMDEYKKREIWSSYLENTFGELAAASFVIGSDILLDHLHEDMEALSSMPKGSHIGEIGASWLESLLPPQFLMRYDYDFLYVLHAAVVQLQAIAHAGNQMTAHSVMEELALYLVVEESRFLIESMEPDDDEIDYDSWDEWIFDLFDDMDLITFLYSDLYVTGNNTYHFDHWTERQFYCQ
ncbi:helix-turn-helix domain-containing protein [Lacrimispora sp. NSJ-141]|uniref:Helix-turn-helix domain-containing protein n=1 Tax=Lientehia hominis TaxID=2897778 RepID=A0AAP2RGV5_9FIRM|nr:helix-turn-helix transcriptional regulator [Lientehia hominis]MCD2491676.1 helix-turn-helix domain-containing protein [Lientehia hominis]